MIAKLVQMWKILPLRFGTLALSNIAARPGLGWVAVSASKSSIRRAFSWLKAATAAFTFKTLC